MDWKEFFKPNKIKITLFVIFLMLPISIYFLNQTTVSEKNPSASNQMGIPPFYTHAEFCDGITYEEFQKLNPNMIDCSKINSLTDFSFVNLIINLLWAYLIACLILIKKSFK